ncbi:MAG: GTP-binding protein [Anaerolineae bacterium]|nr:GTP-binding protein [Anaerolineae bacterium]
MVKQGSGLYEGKLTVAKLYKLVVTGAFNAGKTTFVNTLSQIKVVNTDKTTHLKTEARIKSATTVALDYSQARINGGLKVHLFGTPGQMRFDFMHQLLAEGMHGFIFLVDTTDRSMLKQSTELLNLFRKRGNVPYLLVANKVDRQGLSAEEIRQHFKLPPRQPVMSCVATNRASVQAVVERLVAMIQAAA